MQFILFIVLAGILLLLLYMKAIRPQQQVLRAQQQVVASLAVGDMVISSAGIFGRITSLSEDVAHLEVAPGIEIQVARAAVARRVDLDGHDRLASQLSDFGGQLPASGSENAEDADHADEPSVGHDQPAVRED